jgi:DNA-binding LytR/AlgR family response regulator
MIYVLEDDQVQWRYLQGILQYYFQRIGQAYSVGHAFEVGQFLQLTQHLKPDDICLLDIEIGHDYFAGLQVAKQLLRQQPAVRLVFITAHREMAISAFNQHILPVDFIDKNLSKVAFVQRIYDILQQPKQRHLQYLDWHSTQKTLHIAVTDVVYLHVSQPHQLEIVTTDSHFWHRGQLKNYQEIADLSRAHQGYLVNIAHVVDYDDQRLWLTKQRFEVPISRRYRKALLQLLVSRETP